MFLSQHYDEYKQDWKHLICFQDTSRIKKIIFDKIQKMLTWRCSFSSDVNSKVFNAICNCNSRYSRQRSFEKKEYDHDNLIRFSDIP